MQVILATIRIRLGYNITMAEDKAFPISIGAVEAQWDETNENYVVDISFNRGGSAEYVMDEDQLSDFESNPSGSYYNANIRLS